MITAQSEFEQVTDRPELREKSGGELHRGIAIHLHRVDHGNGEDVSEVGQEKEEHEKRWPAPAVVRFSDDQSPQCETNAEPEHGQVRAPQQRMAKDNPFPGFKSFACVESFSVSAAS